LMFPEGSLSERVREDPRDAQGELNGDISMLNGCLGREKYKNI